MHTQDELAPSHTRTLKNKQQPRSTCTHLRRACPRCVGRGVGAPAAAAALAGEARCGAVVQGRHVGEIYCMYIYFLIYYIFIYCVCVYIHIRIWIVKHLSSFAAVAALAGRETRAGALLQGTVEARMWFILFKYLYYLLCVCLDTSPYGIFFGGGVHVSLIYNTHTKNKPTHPH